MSSHIVQTALWSAEGSRFGACAPQSLSRRLVESVCVSTEDQAADAKSARWGAIPCRTPSLRYSRADRPQGSATRLAARRQNDRGRRPIPVRPLRCLLLVEAKSLI